MVCRLQQCVDGILHVQPGSCGDQACLLPIIGERECNRRLQPVQDNDTPNYFSGFEANTAGCHCRLPCCCPASSSANLYTLLRGICSCCDRALAVAETLLPAASSLDMSRCTRVSLLSATAAVVSPLIAAPPAAAADNSWYCCSSALQPDTSNTSSPFTARLPSGPNSCKTSCSAPLS